MLVEHTLTVTAKCPINGSHDVYNVTFRLNRLVNVEELLKVAEGYTRQSVYQEDLTQQLSNLFQCEVESHGSHSNVMTRVVCQHVTSCERDSEASDKVIE